MKHLSIKLSAILLILGMLVGGAAMAGPAEQWGDDVFDRIYSE